VLLANAWRHGDAAVTITARASIPGAVVVRVGDEGAGTLDGRAVFDRRTDGTHGVGLALARALAEAEGGRLVLERPGPQPVFALVLSTEGT
jgi:signal transduction histidine kinase